MNGYSFFHPPFPAGHSQTFCPCCHQSLVLPKVALHGPEEDLLTPTTVCHLLDEQHHYYRELIGQQERNYRAFLQVTADASSRRADRLLRELQDLRTCLRRTQAELADVREQASQNGKRAEWLAEGLATVREALGGLSATAGAGGRGRGAAGLRSDGGRVGRRGREAKRAEPKAAKLVADVTDIRFDHIKVVRTPGWKAERALAVRWLNTLFCCRIHCVCTRLMLLHQTSNVGHLQALFVLLLIV